MKNNRKSLMNIAVGTFFIALPIFVTAIQFIPIMLKNITNMNIIKRYYCPGF